MTRPTTPPDSRAAPDLFGASDSLWTRLQRGLRDRLVRQIAALALALAVVECAAHGTPRLWGWVDLGWLPVAVALPWVAWFGFAVLAWRWQGARLRRASRVVVGSAAVLCAVDACGFWAAIAGGALATPWPLPLSAVAAVALASWAYRPPRPAGQLTAAGAVRWLGGDAALAGAALLAWCAAAGSQDCRRPADAIVVYGAAVAPSGRPSRSLYDRTRAGCALYQQGLARHLVFSGGQAENRPVSEPAAMLAIATEMGIPRQAVVLDEAGTNTLATVRNCARLGATRGWSTFLMVSHDYHLARIRMFARRAALTAFTVPAAESRRTPGKLRSYLRELAALVAYGAVPGGLAR